jgi:hypothetical protein
MLLRRRARAFRFPNSLDVCFRHEWGSTLLLISMKDPERGPHRTLNLFNRLRQKVPYSVWLQVHTADIMHVSTSFQSSSCHPQHCPASLKLGCPFTLRPTLQTPSSLQTWSLLRMILSMQHFKARTRPWLDWGCLSAHECGAGIWRKA